MDKAQKGARPNLVFEVIMEQKAKETIAKYHMLREGDRVAVAVSGGADSVALLHFLHTAVKPLALTLRVCHINHNLRGAESDGDRDFVKSLAAQYQLPYREHSFDAAALAKEQGASVEEVSRRRRYAFLAEVAGWAEEGGPGGKIATAHTLTDSLETTLINLARGTGLRGLAGIAPVRDNIIRPLIACTREEVEAYCRTHGLDWRTDSSNLTDAYSRNRVRRHVTPVLQSLNPALYGAAARMGEALRRDEDYLTQAAGEALEALREGSGISREGFLALHPALQARVMAKLFAQGGAPVSARLFDLAGACACRGSGAVELAGGIYFTARRDILAVGPAAPVPEAAPGEGTLPHWEALADGAHTFSIGQPGRRLALCFTSGTGGNEGGEKFNTKPYKNTLENPVDCAKINGDVIFRGRQPGDAVCLIGRGGRKSLKKLLNEAGVPPAQRGAVLVLCDREGPFWVEGFGPDRRVCADSHTTRFAQISVLAE